MVEVLIILYLLEVVVVLQGQAAATTIVQLLSVLTIIHSTMMLTRTTMTLLTIVLHITNAKDHGLQLVPVILFERIRYHQSTRVTLNLSLQRVILESFTPSSDY